MVLVVGVLLALAPLTFFKYFNFINDNLSEILAWGGWETHLSGLNWAIPIGISFFTFQALGYLWDVYYRKQEAEEGEEPVSAVGKRLRPYFDYGKAVEGLKMILWGMFAKVVVADRLSLFVDIVLPNYMHYTGMTCFVASVFYTIQIYADFSGYSLMAIGVGKVLGFELTENFRRPYFAVSVTDFWRRWHISLSTWLKDYVYIPLGGSRCAKWRNYWNIFVTFLVSGIWHGANWTFVIWGCMHGVFQIVEKMLGERTSSPTIQGKAMNMTP